MSDESRGLRRSDSGESLFRAIERASAGVPIIDVLYVCFNVIGRGILLSSSTMEEAEKMLADASEDIRQVVLDNIEMLGEGVATTAQEGEHGAN